MADEKVGKDMSTIAVLERAEEQRPIVEHSGTYGVKSQRTRNLELIETKVLTKGATSITSGEEK